MKILKIFEEKLRYKNHSSSKTTVECKKSF